MAIGREAITLAAKEKLIGANTSYEDILKNIEARNIADSDLQVGKVEAPSFDSSYAKTATALRQPTGKLAAEPQPPRRRLGQRITGAATVANNWAGRNLGIQVPSGRELGSAYGNAATAVGQEAKAIGQDAIAGAQGGIESGVHFGRERGDYVVESEKRLSSIKTKEPRMFCGVIICSVFTQNVTSVPS